MTIVAGELKFYKSATNNDSGNNGGRISTTEIVTNTANNLFPNATQAERTAGVTRYRKEFLRNKNASDLTYSSSKVWIGDRSDADDYFQIHAGTDTDTQTDWEGYTNWYGAGLLNTSVASGETELIVDYDTASGVFSGEGLQVYVNDGSNTATVGVVGTPTWLGSTATFSISGELGANFSATTTTVSTILSLGDVAASTNSWTETSSSGTYNESTYPVITYNVGTATDSFTLTFSDASNFNCTGAVTGSLGSGDISTDFQPANGSSYYFKVNKNGWGGTWAAGETVTFNTVHSGKAIVLKQVVPAGTSSYSNSVVELSLTGESA